MFYVLHGDEEFGRSEAVSRLRAQVVSDGMGDLNIIVLDGRKVKLNELIDACNAIPFLTERRLIIVEGLLQRFEPKASSRREEKAAARSPADRDYADGLATYLPHLPPSTRLVFVETRELSARNPILKEALASNDGYVREFKPLKGTALEEWVRRRSRQKGAEITRPAAKTLVSCAGDSLRQLDQELAKLAGYVNYSRPITDDDIRALVSAAHDANIFALVDAMGMRDRERAMRELQELLASGASDLYLLTMVARQVRLILSVKDLAQEKGLGPDQIRRELRISHRFILDKLLKQARWFDLEELESIQRRILGIDQAIKTGRIEGALALELLVVEVCRRRAETPGQGYQGRRRERTRSARASSSASPEQRSR